MIFVSALPRMTFALAVGLLVTAWPHPSAAQDVELWGAIHGTRPPEGYYETLRRDPDAFRFQVEGMERLQRMRSAGIRGPVAPGAAAARSLGPLDEAVTGTYRFPLVLGTFADGPATLPFDSERIQDHFFDGPNAQGPTIPDYYDEISNGLVALEGQTSDWQTVDLARAQVTLGQSGLFSDANLGVGAFIERIVLALDAEGVDWSRFDSDGDGYVDVLTVIHPDRGAECDGQQQSNTRIWSHRWTLREATQNRLEGDGERDGVRTSTPHPGGGFIHVNDYTIQPLLSCESSEANVRIAEIGTFAHELGHAFGLPDLYRTDAGLSNFYAGAGNWDLMGSGSYGCGGGSPELPCHPGAWTKEALGWVTVDEISPDTSGSVTLEPVETSGRVLKLPARDGSGDYVLVENRQRIGSDAGLIEPGLLVWQIDPEVLQARWPVNRVNNDPTRLGVWLRQADGRDDLTHVQGGRGDPGDPFPGCIKDHPLDYQRPEIPCGTNPDFHAGEAPFALSHLGGGLGVTLTDIPLGTGGPNAVEFDLDTRVFTLRVEAESNGAPASVDGFEVDGEPRSATPFELVSAPFQKHTIVAGGGIPSGPDERAGFIEWENGAARSRSHTTAFSDAVLVASYGLEQIRLGVSTNDPADGIAPATFVANPGNVVLEGDDFWFAPGTDVSVNAMPRDGFTFREWVGVDAPEQNPLTFTLDAPMDIRADFDLAYAFDDVDESLTIEAAIPQNLAFEVTGANEPVVWSVTAGSPPPGLSLGTSSGRLTGSANETGEYPIEIRALDAIGLEVRASVLITVEPPNVGLRQLASTFVDSADGVSFPQKQFLDQNGNGNGTYDVGDFRAFALAHPDLPESVPSGSPARRVVPLGSVHRLEAGP